MTQEESQAKGEEREEEDQEKEEEVREREGREDRGAPGKGGQEAERSSSQSAFILRDVLG